jgi:hypothetical protein
MTAEPRRVVLHIGDARRMHFYKREIRAWTEHCGLCTFRRVSVKADQAQSWVGCIRMTP